MCTKMMYDIITFKNVFQCQTPNFKNVKPKLILHQANMCGHRNLCSSAMFRNFLDQHNFLECQELGEGEDGGQHAIC